ncbi:MAG: hypothetical protein ABSG78_07270 [Verrucomicrobiota bacterium]|jgi:hypothetical protein
MGNLKIPPDRKNCVERVTHKKILLSGKKTSRLYLLNPYERSVEKVQVDGCAITDGTCCDWAVELDARVSREEIFIELKGSHITVAVKQIEATITRLSSSPAQTKKRCLVVSKRYTVTESWFQRQQRRFQRDFKADLNRARNGESLSLEPAM